MHLAELETGVLDAARTLIRSGAATERGLARAAGLSQPHVHNVLKGTRRLSIDSADRLAAVLPPHTFDYPVSSVTVGQQDRLKRLASNIDTLIDKDDARARQAGEIHDLRRRAACELHAVCSGFVASVNTLLTRTRVDLDPPEFAADRFAEKESGIFQVNVRGRILQIEFSAPDELVSTEHFRVPYVLEGSARCFNQDLLDRALVEEQNLFYCLERGRRIWRYFDGRTYQTGLFNQEYLTELLERLV